MINKKGFEIQFNWIFVLIVGGLILLFFVLVVVKQKNISEEGSSVGLLKIFNSIITSASVSKDVIKIDNIPKSELSVSCNRLGSGKNSKKYQNLILFSPRLIKGNKLLWQTLDFSLPYRAVNMLFMTSLDVRYIIIGDKENTDYGPLLNQVLDLLPEHLKKEVHKSTSNIDNKNNYKVRFVFFDNIDTNVLADFDNMLNEHVTALSVDIPNKKVEFYEKEKVHWNPIGSSNYFDKATLVAAIYADTKELYDCSLNNVLERYKLVTQVYEARLGKIQADPIEPRCKDNQDQATSNFQKVKTTLDGINKLNPLSESIVNNLITLSQSLEANNNDAQKKSCPLIY